MVTTIALLLPLFGTTGCENLSKIAGSPSLPSGIQDPSTYNTPAGALGLYRAALYNFSVLSVSAVGGAPGTEGTQATDSVTNGGVNGRGSFLSAVLVSGLLSDELQDYATTPQISAQPDAPGVFVRRTDQRNSPGNIGVLNDNTYGALQQIRGAAEQAIGALATYGPDLPTDLRGELYAIKGFTEIFLADIYCSGIPLSTLDFGKDYTYQPGSSTSQVYQHAVALFDTAFALSPDSIRVQHLARVGKGRALLALGQFAQAAEAVSAVPDAFQQAFVTNWCYNTQACLQNAVFSFGATPASGEGGNGLPFALDSRSASSEAQLNAITRIVFPNKYGGINISTAPLNLADGIEARLIEAEASLHAGDTVAWLNTLNHLRATATVPGMTAPLAPLTDPGTTAARVTLMFDERAYWLYLTGHRQGDLRRLIRQYGRSAQTVYPIGPYRAGGTYGSDVNVPIPPQESLNPLFRGCISRGA